MTRASAAVVPVVLFALLSACSPKSGVEPSPVSLDWREAALVLPAGASRVPVVRDAVVCGGKWFVVGAVRDGQGATSPAAWELSADGASSTSVAVNAESFYGKQNVLYTVACREGVLAAVGAKPGGAHGNPRTSSWVRVADGAFQEVSARFELYGGPAAVSVGRLSAGAAGFLITGNRTSGAAVWSSVDASEFTIAEGVPGLASDAAALTWVSDAVAVDSGWLAVGGVLPTGRPDRDPAGWSSAGDGVWRRSDASGASDEYEELQRVVLVDGVPVASGVRGKVFGVWRWESGRWQPSASFGAVSPSAWSGVRSLAAVGSRLLAVVGDGSAYEVWVSGDGGAGWRRGALPVAVRGVSGSSVSVSAGSGRWALCSDDGVTGRVFTAVTGP